MRIELTTDIESRFQRSLRHAARREIGGMLFAEQLKPGHFRIVDFSLDSFSGSHVSFRRDPTTHQKALEEFFDRTGHDFRRFNYLGEWHTHPSFSVRPSAEDMATMIDIVDDASKSIITFAILLILRLRFRLWIDHSLTIFARNRVPQSIRISQRVKWI
jgi:[CysO sulfur-carrier protein]-S-L-cysteine hydrolase